MASEVDIINVALRMVGGETITARDDGSNNASSADDIFDEYRDFLLRSYLWKFATKRIKLARSSNTPAFGYDYQYPIPSDFLRIIAVYDNQDGLGYIEYKLEYDDTDTRVIATNVDELWLTYVAKITDTAAMDPMFRHCLSLKLAATFAIDIAESNTLSREYKDELKSALRKARSASALEDFPPSLPEGSWVGVRQTSSDEGWV